MLGDSPIIPQPCRSTRALGLSVTKGVVGSSQSSPLHTDTIPMSLQSEGGGRTLTPSPIPSALRT